ncbi:MAG TPA: hypothetical protein VEL28_05625 [Candidatus Binatia bacterium]|nr:hypothetical protein [Candidatus Binatia bacterium]
MKPRARGLALGAGVSFFLLTAGAMGSATAAVVPAGEEIVLGTAQQSVGPKHAVRAANRFAIVHEDGEPSRVVLRYVEPLGESATDAIEIAADGFHPRAAAFPDGSLVIVWESAAGVFVRFVDASGSPTTDAIALEAVTGGNVVIAAGSQGNWVLAFHRLSEQSQTTEIVGLRYNGATPLSEEPFSIGPASGQTQLAMLVDDSFVATWAEDYTDPECVKDPVYCNFDISQTYLNGRAFDAAAEPARDARRIATDFHDDEQGKSGHAVVALEPDGFVAAWLDYIESDYEPPGYLAMRRLDASGSGAAPTMALAEVDRDAVGLTLAVTSAQVAIAIAQDLPGQNYDIEIYSASIGGGPVEKLSLADPAMLDFAPALAAGAGGAMLLVWERQQDGAVVTEIVARSLFVAATILCGDADHDGQIVASDALGTLHAAVGAGYCAGSVCDADGNEQVLASDAARVLAVAVGIETPLDCPAAGTDVPPPFEDPWW